MDDLALLTLGMCLCLLVVTWRSLRLYQQYEPTHMTDSMDQADHAALSALVQAAGIAAVSMPASIEAVAALRANLTWHNLLEAEDSVSVAPAVEYRLHGKSFDEYGCEIQPTLPFERL